jgi:hypothetical protein
MPRPPCFSVPSARPRAAPPRAPALAAALLLSACGCPKFSEMQVEDPAGIGSDWDRSEFARAISDFAAWTGREGVCVPALEIRDSLADGMAIGLYQGPHQHILLVPGSGHDTAVHEMCHAIDQQLGWISNHHIRKFPTGHIDSALYPYRFIQVQESFARICELGPRALDLQGHLERRCELSMEHPGQRFVLDEIFTEVIAPVDPVEVGELTVERRGLAPFTPPGGQLRGVASGDRLLWLLSETPPPPVDMAQASTGLRATTWTLIGVDPATFTVAVRRDLLRDPPDDPLMVSVLGLADSEGEPPLLIEAGLGVRPRIWEIDEETGALTELPAPVEALGAAPWNAVRSGDTLFLLRPEAYVPVEPPEGGADTGAQPLPLEGGWLAVDLRTGEPTRDHPVVRVLDQPVLGGGLADLTATAAGLQLRAEPGLLSEAYAGYAARVGLLDPVSGELRQETVSAALFEAPIGVLPDGSLLATWYDRDPWDDIEPRAGLVVGQDEPRRYWLPADACSRLVDLGAPIRLMHLGDAAWALMTWDGGLELVRIGRGPHPDDAG